jgi:asparagine synthetase B (glutamine-hydrolysing)
MCGIIGVSLNNITREQIKIVSNLIKESGIRGIHATGVSFLRGDKIITITNHKSSSDFLQDFLVNMCVDSKKNKLTMLAHTRYSTSDLRYNQPLGNERLAIVHNGVISQAPPKEWKKEFGLTTKTTNDSELILQSLNAGEHPLTKFKGSMAVCGLSNDGGIFAFRNGERPLWYKQFGNGIIFASTEDILRRCDCPTAQKCDFFTEYVYYKGITKQLFTVPDEFEAVDLQ